MWQLMEPYLQKGTWNVHILSEMSNYQMVIIIKIDDFKELAIKELFVFNSPTKFKGSHVFHTELKLRFRENKW